MPQKVFPWNSPLNGVAYNTDTATGNTTLAAAKVTGGQYEVDLAMTGALAAGATATTDTAANIVAAIPSKLIKPGYSYKLRVINESSGAFAWTIAGGTGVTVNGTATVAQNTWRDFVLTVTGVGSSAAVTLQNVGSGNA